ncbi:MAG: hypothetical protein HKM92_10560 [Arenibacter sp.]|nr:hypothetical protein [Muriicola sp.]NNE04061.1 hypothetical protein [Eudoraea sp.]NNG10604.1 hypothetical protein [Arenibacter sp.]
MERKKFIVQVGIAILLYMVVSLILEKDMSVDTLVKELKDGLIFGLVYAVFLFVWNRYKKKDDS